jgi:hypothetical protein
VKWPLPDRNAALREPSSSGRASRSRSFPASAFERDGRDPGAAEKQRLEHALTEGGAVFIAENGGGVGVRLKFSRRDVRAINKWEGEGGPAGEDDV